MVDDFAGEGLSARLGLVAGALEAGVEQVFPPGFGGNDTARDLAAFAFAAPGVGDGAAAFEEYVLEGGAGAEEGRDGAFEAGHRAVVSGFVFDEAGVAREACEAGAQAEVYGEEGDG